MTTNRLATDNQRAFYASIIRDIAALRPAIAEVADLLNAEFAKQTVAQASVLIDKALANVKAARAERAATPAATPAATGTATPAAEKVVKGTGLYRLNDGTFVRIQQGQNGLYGKRLAINPRTGTGEFIYERGLTNRVNTEGRKVTAEEAENFGLNYGFCIACCKELSTVDSLFAGFGHTCANTHGWEYLKISTRKGREEAIRRGLLARVEAAEQKATPAPESAVASPQAKHDADDAFMRRLEAEGDRRDMWAAAR